MKEKKGVRLEHISKIYKDPKTGKDFYAVEDTTLDIEAGTFVTLLGPSGCGKTTTLRMIAGFESPDEGEIYLGGEAINHLTPNKRDTAMVFQSYALLPHYNVFDNVAYGLKIRKVSREEIRERVMNILKLVEMGIMEGTVEEDGLRYFYPDQGIKREEMAAIIWRMMNVDYTQGMIRYNNYWLDVLEEVPATRFAPDQFVEDERGRLSWTQGGYYTRGIDVSGHKKEIDWNAVAMDGIDFAIIRAGNRLYGKDSAGTVCEDSWFERNMEGAIAAGMDVGAYFFSNAITVEEALEEADLLISKLEPYRQHITYPVVCDWEYLGGNQSRAYGVDAKIITQCVAAFCQRVEEAGYQPMFYFNKYCGYVKFDLSELIQYPFWFAEYTDYSNVPSSIYDFQMWQYSSKGKVAGISSDVDMNLCFVPWPGATRRPGVTPEGPPPTDSPEPTPAPTQYVEPVWP